MSEQERAELVARLASRDADALQRLIVYYHAALRRAVARALRPALQPHLEPDDVLQQAYIAAFRNAPQVPFTGPGHFYAGLEQVALNQLKDAHAACGGGSGTWAAGSPRDPAGL